MTLLTPWSHAQCVEAIKTQIAANVAADDARLADRNAAIIDAVRAGNAYVTVAAQMDVTPGIVAGVIQRHAPELVGRYRGKRKAAA